ncbi:MAG: D-alanyl-D-alanine carboxypeptidase family protein [Pseudomonadota bacterium]
MTVLKSLALSMVAAFIFCLPAKAFDTTAKAAFVLDMETGTILLSKNADEALPPASMSKLMTLYVAFEALKSGQITLKEKLPVSEHAMSYGGSTMFLDTTDRVTVEDLLRGVIVLSGNDACVVLAEALSPDGTEAGFSRYMTQRAAQLGMTNSIFTNSNGWPDTNHVMSMRDLVLLARLLIQDFPEFYPMFAETEFAFDGRAPQNTRNRNPLLRLNIGADGLKTGHTQASGFGLVGSAKQGDRRVIFAFSGLDSASERAEQAEAIVNWSFRQFAEKTLVTEGTEVARANIWMGEATSVGLTPAEDLRTLVPILGDDSVKAEVVYTGPVRAPVAQGDQLAEMVFAPAGLPEMRIPLVAANDVARGGFVVRLKTAALALLRQLQNGPEGAL